MSFCLLGSFGGLSASRSSKSAGAPAVTARLGLRAKPDALPAAAIAGRAWRRQILDQFQSILALAEAVVPGDGLRGYRNHDLAGPEVYDLAVGAGDLTEVRWPARAAPGHHR